ncbi:LamG-like jellyroll fold domain-containing protein [Polaribacter vadi]|uniref:LamG-like jellyroll fold domain-containing protein n=1 Tax=Polaribacter vadi TaxID=1774273 RepID=UPI0030EF01FA|tara:strand:+ start:3075 stop:6677 length:3603 start_codon:yes stop_codon:yes gene_type:complete
MKKIKLTLILFIFCCNIYGQVTETEPNNTIDASGVITITEDGTFNGSFNQYDIDFFKIKSYAVGNVTFDWISAPVVGNGLYIYEDDSNYGSTYLTRVLNPEQVTVTLNPNKYYIVRLHTGTATGSWSFSVSGLKFAPVISTSTATAITKNSTIIGGNITSDNGNAVTERGIVYSTSDSTPEIGEAGVTKDDEGGIGTGVFSETISGLTKNTLYYYRAYAINDNGTSYGSIKSFTTLNPIPILTTSDATSITKTTATLEGNITSNNGNAITERGIIYSSTNSTPEIGESGVTKEANGTGTGVFSETITNLTKTTVYYYRAYAINSEGTGYGDVKNFTTLDDLPTVTTTDATSVETTSAILGGNVTSQGDSAVTERGIVYSSTDTNPKIRDSEIIKNDNGTGTGVFTESITGFTANTTYFYRAYATNSQGTAYGEVKSFNFNHALNFDGSDDRIIIPDNGAFDFSSGFTAEAWINPDVLGTQTYLSQYNSNQEAFAFILLASGRIEFTVTTDGTTDQYFESSAIITPGEWSHVALTFDGATMKAYINGVPDGTKVVTGTMFPSTAPIEIGARNNNYFFNGSIDEVRIWSRVLTATEINNQKDKSVPANANGLAAYYKFNQGIAYGDNTAITSLTDSGANSLHGTLNNFTKTETSSNFVKGVTGFGNAVTNNTFSTTGNWSTPSNWSLGIVPTQIDKVTIGSGKTVTIDVDDLTIDDFTLESGATLSIPKDKEITIQNSFVSNGTLELGSDATDSGVLFVEGTSTGNITYKRGGLFSNKWSIVTPPVSGQTVKSFVENAANDIRINTTPDPDRYAIAYYDDSQNSGSKWVYYNADVDENTEFNAGQSYSISRATDGEVTFTGTLTIDDLQKTLIADQWNAIGNPFTTYYPANKNSNSSFLNDNTHVLDDAFKSLYLWDNAQGKYVAITEVDIAARSLPPGQGFFIKMKTGETEIIFNKEKRSTKPSSGTSTFEKSTSTPTITLKVTNETKTVTTDIKYFENATYGLDPGFDIGNFNSSSLDIYTRLLDENISTNFTIQSLPLNSYENAIIPIGLNGNNGDRITFTIASINIPNSINIYLEDKEKNTYQKLSETNGNYTIVLKDKVSGVGRFYLHTNSKSLGTKQISTLEDVSIFNTNRILKINGLKKTTANIKLYSILGKEVLSKDFIANKKNEILLPKISKGVYLVKLITVEGTLNKKIIID